MDVDVLCAEVVALALALATVAVEGDDEALLEAVAAWAEDR